MADQLFRPASWALSKALFGAREGRHFTRMQAVQPMLDAIAERHTDDPAGLQKATMRFYRNFDINPFASIGWGMGRMLAWNVVLNFGTRHGRTIRASPPAPK